MPPAYECSEVGKIDLRLCKIYRLINPRLVDSFDLKGFSIVLPELAGAREKITLARLFSVRSC
jgi:hypothetical protein